MDKYFYLRFEDLHRGEKAEIINRFKKYERILYSLAEKSDAPTFLDLGCGRGEFLSYLASLKITATGIEKNISLAPEKLDKSVEIIEGDALSWLRNTKDNSYDFISAIHVIEHLEFQYFYELTREIKRVLKKNGVVLFETPNPDNLLVATSNFYVDPTHLRLIPQKLVEFVLNDTGFYKTFSWGVNESSTRPKNIKVSDILGGSSPDYAIFGLANHTPLSSKIEEVLSEKKGRTTKELCDSFEQRYLRDYTELMERQKKDYTELMERQKKIEDNIYDQNCFYRDQYIQVTQEIYRVRDIFENELERIYSSRSWKITAPLRQIARLIRKCSSIAVNLKSNFARMSFREFLQNYRTKVSSRLYALLDGSEEEETVTKDESVKGVLHKRYKRLLASLKKKK